MMRFLVAGWFSFEKRGVTAGDLLAKDVVCQWLEQLNRPYDVAFAPPLSEGVSWREVEPDFYSHVVFVCGPFPYIRESVQFLQRFRACRLIGVDLSMIESLDRWNPFDVLIERDSSRCSRPDITLIAPHKRVPIVGIILVAPQQEYGDRGRHQFVNEVIQRLVESQAMAAVPIDTCLDSNQTNLRNAAEIESLISRMDFVITTRLHGTVLALKNGIPAIAIDPISGGAKVLRQARTIGWSVVFTDQDLSDEALQQAFQYCQTVEARAEAQTCREKAAELIEQIRQEFVTALTDPNIESSRLDWSDSADTQMLLNQDDNPPLPLHQRIRKFIGFKLIGLAGRLHLSGKSLI